MHPTSVLLLVSPGEVVNVFDRTLRQRPDGPTISTVRIDISYYGPRDCALMPLVDLVYIGGRMPHLRRLELANVMLLPSPQAVPPPFPNFAHLETLSIDPWHAQLSQDAEITTSLFQSFAHMPRLRNLAVRSPMLAPYCEHIHPTTCLPNPPFSLEKFSCAGTLPVLACAHIIERSHATLRDLELTMTVTGNQDEARLVVSMAHAAPRIRHLDLHLRGDLPLVPPFRPVFAWLSRLASLRLITPQNTTLPAALGLLAHAPANLPLHKLILIHEGVPFDPFAVQREAKQLIDATSQTRRLRHLLLVNFYIGYPDEQEKLDLLELSRARRIRCQIMG